MLPSQARLRHRLSERFERRPIDEALSRRSQPGALALEDRRANARARLVFVVANADEIARIGCELEIESRRGTENERLNERNVAIAKCRLPTEQVLEAFGF